MINKFYLMSGMDSNGDYLGDPKTSHQILLDIINRFDCNQTWPICMFDFTYKNKVPHYFVFKVDGNLTSNIRVEDYFSNKSQKVAQNKISESQKKQV